MKQRARYVAADSGWRNVLTGELVGGVIVTPPTTSRDDLVLGEYKPGPTTTGPLPGTVFTVVTTATNATVAGKIWDGYDFRHGVTIQAYDQVFRNCIFRGNPAGTTRTAGITGHSSVGGGMGRATFIDCKFEQQEPNLYTNGVSNGLFTMRRCEISGWVDGIGLTGAQTGTTIEQSWIHNGYWGSWTPGDPNFPGQEDGQTHNDAIQFHRGKNITIRGNYIGGARNTVSPNAGDDYNNACIMLSQEVDSSAANKIENVLIEKNWFEGGASGINIYPKNGNTFSSVTIRDNRFIRRGFTPAWYIIRNGTAATITGNVFDDTGLPVTLN